MFFFLRLCSLLLSASLQLSFLSPLTFPPSLSALEKYAWERSKCATAQSIKCLHDIILHQASSVGSKTKKRTENNCFALSLLSSPIPALPFSQLAHIFPAGWRCFRSVRRSPIVEDKSSFCLTFQHCWGVSSALICTFQGANGTH